VFTILYATVADSKPNLGGLEIPKELLEYSDVFLNKKAGTLPIFKEGNYIIKIEDSKELPYRPLYNLS